MSIDEATEVDISIIAFNDFGLWLKGAHHALDVGEFIGTHFGGLVEENDIAELYLLDDEVFDVLFVKVGLGEGFAAAKLVLETQGIDHGDDAVETRSTESRSRYAERRDRADGLGDGGGFADAAGLDYDIVEFSHGHDVLDLFYEIHFEGAAYATVG